MDESHLTVGLVHACSIVCDACLVVGTHDLVLLHVRT